MPFFSRLRRVLSMATIGAFALGLGGCLCAQMQQQQALTKNLEVVPPALRTLNWLGGPSTALFRGDQPDDSGRLRVEHERTGPGQWTVRRWRVSGSGSAEQALAEPGKLLIQEDLATRADGGVVLLRQFNHAEGVEVVFDPPVLVLPPLAHEQGPWTQNFQMRIFPLTDPNHVRTEGPAKSTLEAHAGGTRTLRDGRTVETVRLDNTLTASLPPAQVYSLTTLWYAPDLGLVAENDAETTRVFFPIHQRNEHWVLEAVGAPGR